MPLTKEQTQRYIDEYTRQKEAGDMWGALDQLMHIVAIDSHSFTEGDGAEDGDGTVRMGRKDQVDAFHDFMLDKSGTIRHRQGQFFEIGDVPEVIVGRAEFADGTPQVYNSDQPKEPSEGQNIGLYRFAYWTPNGWVLACQMYYRKGQGLHLSVGGNNEQGPEDRVIIRSDMLEFNNFETNWVNGKPAIKAKFNGFDVWLVAEPRT